MAKDKKSVSDVNHIVKKSNTKLSELQAELQELDSQLLVTQGNMPVSPMAPGEHAHRITLKNTLLNPKICVQEMATHKDKNVKQT